MINKIFHDVEFNVTPLEKISISDNFICITLDDVNEVRWELKFQPYQAIKITTIDCVTSEMFLGSGCFDSQGVFHRYLIQLDESDWIKELDRNLADKTADFLEKSKHFILPLQEIIIEIVAWDSIIRKKL